MSSQTASSRRRMNSPDSWSLEVRPIYHQRDDTSMGHIVASFLALRLEVDLQQRLAAREVKVSWPDLMRDLAQVQSVLLELDGNRYQLRTGLVGAAHQAFVAAGVRPPPTATPLGPLPEVARSGKALFTSLNILLFQNYFLATVEDESGLQGVHIPRFSLHKGL
jgi:hypothetical protein